MRTRFGMVTAAGATLLAVLAFAPPASADDNVHIAASCYGNTCNGKEPDTTGCSADAFTAKSNTTSSGIVVELRYSPTCRAAWGRLRNAHLYSQVTVRNSAGVSFTRQLTGDANGTSVFTRMVPDAGLVAWACTPSGAATHTCTGSY